MTIFRKITDDEFNEIYKPIPNHINPDNGFDFGRGCCLFETFGEELEHVLRELKTKHRHIWTVVDCNGKLIIVSGAAFVNRMGYIFTENPWAENESIEVEDDDYA